MILTGVKSGVGEFKAHRRTPSKRMLSTRLVKRCFESCTRRSRLAECPPPGRLPKDDDAIVILRERITHIPISEERLRRPDSRQSLRQREVEGLAVLCIICVSSRTDGVTKTRGLLPDNGRSVGVILQLTDSLSQVVKGEIYGATRRSFFFNRSDRKVIRSACLRSIWSRIKSIVVFLNCVGIDLPSPVTTAALRTQ
jgi:hypothetical protein